MKNIFLIVVLLLSVNNLTQADMLVSKKDSVVNAKDSTEAEEILHFTNAQIAKIIAESASLNPQIKNLSKIKTTDTVVLKINDSSLYTFSPSRGEYCWIVLERGINKNKLIPIFSTDDSTSVSSERQLDSITVSNFLREVDYYLENRNSPPDSFSSFKESALVDSNSSEKKSSVSLDSNLPKQVAVVQSRRAEKISALVKKEGEETTPRNSVETNVNASFDQKNNNEDILVSDSVFRKNDDDIINDSSLVMKTPNHGYNYGSNESTIIKISVKELVVGIIFIIVFFIATIFAWKDYKKNRSYSQRRYLKEMRKLQKLEAQRIKKEEHLQKE